MSCVGINIGALAAKVAALQGDTRSVAAVPDSDRGWYNHWEKVSVV